MEGSSPGTSETTRVIIRAGAAAAASRPPLMVENCFRTAFIADMGAPQRSSFSFNAISSDSENPFGGPGRSADPPPEIKATTKSSAASGRTNSSSAADAASPRSSGTGWPASMTRILSQCAPKPYLVTTAPVSGPFPNLLQRSGHLRRCFSCAYDNGRSGFFVPEAGFDHCFRIRGIDGRAKQFGKYFSVCHDWLAKSHHIPDAPAGPGFSKNRRRPPPDSRDLF